MTDPLTELATVPPTPLHGALPGARTSIRRTAADLLAVGDDMLEREWRWRATDTDDMELRYAYFAIHERLERAIGTIEVGRAGAPGGDVPLGPAVPFLGAMTAARWDVHGVMAGLPAATWDEDPGGGEWTIRQTMGHILAVQLSYSWYNAWYVSHPAPVGIAERPSDDVMPPEPTEEELAAGTPAEVAARLDSMMDASAAAVGALDTASLDLGARWSGFPVSVGHRLGRYGSHIREHAIQVDKTLAMLHREPSEVERLVRLVLATYGRLEALVIGRPAGDLDRSLAGGLSAIAILSDAVADAEATAVSARRRAAAG